MEYKLSGSLSPGFFGRIQWFSCPIWALFFSARTTFLWYPEGPMKVSPPPQSVFVVWGRTPVQLTPLKNTFPFSTSLGHDLNMPRPKKSPVHRNYFFSRSPIQTFLIFPPPTERLLQSPRSPLSSITGSLLASLYLCNKLGVFFNLPPLLPWINSSSTTPSLFLKATEGSFRDRL